MLIILYNNKLHAINEYSTLYLTYVKKITKKMENRSFLWYFRLTVVQTLLYSACNKCHRSVIWIHMLTKTVHTKKPQEVVYLGRHKEHDLSVVEMKKLVKDLQTKDNINGFISNPACEFDNKIDNDTFNFSWHMDCHDSCLHWYHRCHHGKGVKNG